MSRDVTQRNKNYAYHTKNLPKRPNQSIFETDRTTIDETFDQSDLESEDSAHGTDEISEISIGTRIVKKATNIHQRHYRFKIFKNKFQKSSGRKLLSPDRPPDFDPNKTWWKSLSDFKGFKKIFGLILTNFNVEKRIAQVMSVPWFVSDFFNSEKPFFINIIIFKLSCPEISQPTADEYDHRCNISSGSLIESSMTFEKSFIFSFNIKPLGLLKGENEIILFRQGKEKILQIRFEPLSTKLIIVFFMNGVRKYV